MQDVTVSKKVLIHQCVTAELHHCHSSVNVQDLKCSLTAIMSSFGYLILCLWQLLGFLKFHSNISKA